MTDLLHSSNTPQVPVHVAIIMDGNGRWAQARGLDRSEGHAEGVKTVRRITEAASEAGVKYLTLYAFSTENWRRPKEEVDALMHLIGIAIERETPDLIKNNVRLDMIGDVERMPDEALSRLRGCIERTSHCTGLNLILALSYSARWEITDAARMVQETGLHIKSFYMGGGTPTTLSTDQMDRLLTHLNRSFDLSGCVEYCIEAGRPDTIDREKLQVLLDHGVDRISVNPQSLEDHVLTAIGRRHTARDVEEAMALATGMGFPHVNMDLIAGLPEDTPEGFRRTLDKCLSYGADNITVHTLSLKKGSRILLENFTIPSAEAVGEMLDYANAALRQADFRPYYLYRQKYMSGSFENTGWCISGAEGLYNIYIMEELHSILSLGAGGSTKMVDPAAGRIERVFHAKYPTEYIQRSEKLEENLSAFRQFHENMRG